MARISAILRNVEVGGGDGLSFWCPGCDEAHVVRVRSERRPCWTWNGDVNKPTFSPSIAVTGVKGMTDEEHARYMADGTLPVPRPSVCHSFVADGRIQFLGDCTHAMAGQTVDIPPWPEPM